MPLYRLIDEIIFPPVQFAQPDGLLAIGGDLSPERLLSAYSAAIFPWYSAGEPVLWWSPDPRFVLFPGELRISRSMRQFLGKGTVHITFDRAFDAVISACGSCPRPGQEGTWITGEMRDAYSNLHSLGFAHSVEAWDVGGRLVGGLYGVSLGRVFFGESMFTAIPNGSKAAFVALVSCLREWKFDLVDCQVETRHLGSLGARPIAREEFCRLLQKSLQFDTLEGDWGKIAVCPEVSNSVAPGNGQTISLSAGT